MGVSRRNKVVCILETGQIVRLFKVALAAPLLFALAGCKMVVMDPAGDIAMQQRNLILLATGLMLLIIVPVIAATLFFAWKYRASNTEAAYDPDWHHSTKLELLIWSIPMAVIVVLGSVAWISSHTLDPYRPLSRIGPNRPVPAGMKPLEVDVVALDWKWLFIYPQLGVASVNELAAPVDRPISFRITASSVMNSFYIPALAGQIYAMPRMQTQLHAVINKPGVYDGLSANFSGSGFSDMRFKFKGMSQADFDSWVAGLRASPAHLTRADYAQLAKPSGDEPVRHYATVDPDLFTRIIGGCAAPGQACANDMPGMPDMTRASVDKTKICTPQRVALNTRRPAAAKAVRAE
ncbi:MAG: ubiquinol oxidase subunit II [Alphaproteobacteria bacterium]|nr:ubiquinol oxidase subunit II [Alphaproteobacteria bacterium]